jgi:alkyldihydroxyacetonephosphate synthase
MTTFTPFQLAMLQHELSGICGPEWVVTEEEDRQVYGVDHFWLPRLLVDRDAGLPVPDVVVLPGDTAQLSAVLKLAQQHRIPVTPWGGGSGSQGGIMPVYGGITIDLKRMDRILELDEQSGTITAEAGVNGYELETWLNERGWTLPQYPASVHSATFGGYLAARGSGVLSTKYGKAEDMVLSMEVVLPDGAIVETQPVPNHATGPGIMQLFVGAEGSLGIISKATMRLERLPEVRTFHAVLCPDLTTGLEIGRRIMLKRLQPTTIRLYDERSTQKVAARTLGTTIEEGAWMVVAFDGDRDMAELQERKALAIAAELGARDLGSEPGEHWWNHRYDFYFPPHTYDMPLMFGTTDTVARFRDIERLYRARKAALEDRFADWGLDYFAHFSHWFAWGVMIYDRFFIHEPPQDAVEALRLHNDVWDTAVRVALENGGVINEHHGVGLKLARWVRQQYGEGFRLIEGVKREVDPAGILNPGKMGLGPVS